MDKLTLDFENIDLSHDEIDNIDFENIDLSDDEFVFSPHIIEVCSLPLTPFPKKYSVPTSNMFDVLDDSLQRTEAFSILSDREKLNRVLMKTRMCKYGKECTRKICYFAHSLKELQPTLCLFGDTCKFKNHPDRVCPYLHPDESKREFIKRTGLDKPGKVINLPIQLEL